MSKHAKDLRAGGGTATNAPRDVQVIRVLGKGRAARAQLVRATMPDGSQRTCVEKVFAPGRLTRLIYRLGFQSPFAYQKNRYAILAAFYRRRVAAAVLASSDIHCPTNFPVAPEHPDVAAPLYVRYDADSRAWVLAAEWIDGRGITPAQPDTSRIRRLLQTVTTRGTRDLIQKDEEIHGLVDLMREVELRLAHCGLVGSGWQVAPRALVSTANLLRTDQRYTIIDLESGIPAVLVPRYIFSSLRLGLTPPFDDLDSKKLTKWIADNEALLTFRLGPDTVTTLRRDARRLIRHSEKWKASEFAVFSKPWTLLSNQRRRLYRKECLRRWRQDGLVDANGKLGWMTIVVIWIFGLIPGGVGRFLAKLAGRSDTRAMAKRWLQDSEFRKQINRRQLARRHRRWVDAGRVSPDSTPHWLFGIGHQFLSMITPARMHRFCVDRVSQRDVLITCTLLMVSRKYQAWFGRNQIEKAIDGWQKSQRITNRQARKLHGDLCGDEVRVYTRGFGAHLALKVLAPIKFGGMAAFVGTGNAWFLLSIAIAPLLRSIVTIASWWTTRHQAIPHQQALLTSWIPSFGTAAFLLQMFASRPRLSTFLIRDAASRLGRKIPVYGGADSRTEIAMIRLTDYLIEAMQFLTTMSSRLNKKKTPQSKDAETASTISFRRPSRWNRWLDHQAELKIAASRKRTTEADRAKRVAA